MIVKINGAEEESSWSRNNILKKMVSKFNYQTGQCIRVRENWQNKYCFLLNNFSKQDTRFSVYSSSCFRISTFEGRSISSVLCLHCIDRMKGKIQRKMNWKQASRSRGLCSCAMWQMFPVGSAKQCNLPPRWAGCSRQNASREEIWKKEKIFGKLFSDSHPKSSNYGNFYLYTDF